MAQAVDWALDPSPGWDGNPPSRFCWRRMKATARDRAAAAPAIPGERLERGAGVVDVAAPPASAKLKPPSESCWRTSQRIVGAGPARPAPRVSAAARATANAVRLTWSEIEPSAADVVL